MNIIKVGWILFLGLLIGAVVGGYHIYRQQTLTMHKHISNKEEIKRLEKEQSQEIDWEPEKQKDIETLKKLAKQQGKWWFLHDIEDELGEEFKPLFRSIGEI